jgi:hypothetical protein
MEWDREEEVAVRIGVLNRASACVGVEVVPRRRGAGGPADAVPGVEGCAGGVVPAGAHVDLAGCGVRPVALVADSVCRAGSRARLAERVECARVGKRGETLVGRVEPSEDVPVAIGQRQALGGALTDGEGVAAESVTVGLGAVGGGVGV